MEIRSIPLEYEVHVRTFEKASSEDND